MSVGLGYVHRELGERTPIASLEADGVSRATLIQLIARGISHFSKAQTGLHEMAMASARRTLAESPLAPGDIDVLMFLTNSTRAAEVEADLGHRLLLDLGLDRAYLHGVCFQHCGDLMLGLKTARALVLAGEARHVLMVVADKVTPGGYTRISGSSHVHGDAASSCIVSADHYTHRLGPVAIVHNHELTGAGASSLDIDESLQSHARQVTETVLGRGGLTADEIGLVLTNNFNQVFASRIGHAFGVGNERLFTDNIARTGHCLSSDILINLHDAKLADPESARRTCLLFASSQRSYSAAIISGVDGKA